MAIWSNLRLYPIWAYYQPVPEHARNLQLQRTSAEGAYVWYLDRGFVDIECEGKTARFTPGKWIIPRMQRFGQRFSDDAVIVSVHFMAKWPDGRPLLETLYPLAFSAKPYPELIDCGKRLGELTMRELPGEVYLMFRQSATLETYCQIQSLFHRWVGLLVAALLKEGIELNPGEATDSRLAKAVYTINHADLKLPLDVQQLARECALSVSQLNRLCAAELSSTPNKLFDQRRLEHAQALLRHSDTPIKQVAYLVGFKYPAHFTRWFKKQTGNSPAELRG